MDNLLIFAKEDEEILNSYELLSKQDLDVSRYEEEVKKYPELANQDIYVQKKLTKKEQENLDEIIAKPLMLASTMDVNMIKIMPEEQIDNMIQTASEKIDENLGTMVSQAATAVTKQEYEAIGMNLEEIQNEYIIKVAFQMLGIAFITMASAITIMFLSSKVAAMLGKTLRDKVFKKVLGFSRRGI